jgi:hypothetical protein
MMGHKVTCETTRTGVDDNQDSRLQKKISFSVGSALTPLLGETDERWGRMSLVKPQGQGSMITRTQGVPLVRVMDTPVVLSHNERTRDEHGKTCVQEGLTSR